MGPSSVALVVVGVLAMAAAPGAQQSQTGALPVLMAGVYKTRFRNALVGAQTYVSENILEIVLVRGRVAYFRIHLEFYNGHECAISGVAEASADSLVYRGPNDVDNQPCILTLRRAHDGVHISEGENGACRNQTCGARGGYGFKPDGAADFPLISRRPIRYLPRLLASDEYAQALKAYEARAR
jgi:hypothetical protein